MRARILDASALVIDAHGRARKRVGSGVGGARIDADSPPAGNSRERVANPASSPYRSKWELAFSKQLDAEKLAGAVLNYWYEPFSLWLPGGVRYKPDFMIQRILSGHTELEIVEVKGYSKNRRDGITRLKIAAALFPCFTWRLVWMEGHSFNGIYITV